MNFSASVPEINATKNETISGKTGTLITSAPFAISKISTNIEAKMIGMLIRKECFETSFLSPPLSTPAHIVEPEREIPGKIAIPCAIPIKIACFVDNFCEQPFANKSEKRSTQAVSIKLKGKIFSLNELFAGLYNISTKTIVTSVDIINFFSCSLNGFLIISQISFRITIKTDKRVAMCKRILTKRLSFMPKIELKRTRCPLDDTGKNSVKPCKSPRIINANIIFKFIIACP